MEQTELFIEKLENWGCDVDGAMDRFLGETELYHDCLQAVTADGALTELKTALEAGNVKNAFEAAHTLKGVLANLGVTPMYEIVVKLVEPLRSGERRTSALL